MTSAFPIGRASREAGVKVTTIRYYEQAGLMPRPERSERERRLYVAADVSRLKFIRHARDLGFAMDDVRTLLTLADHPREPCGEADAIARRHLADVEAKITALAALRGELERMIDSCEHGTAATCRVLESLADHAGCDGEHVRT